MADVCPETPQKPQWILQNRIFSLKKYWQTGPFKAVEKEFCAHFETENEPPKSTVQGWINMFDEFGTVGNVNKASDDRPTHSGRPRKRTLAVI